MNKVNKLILMSLTVFAMISGFSASASNNDITIIVAEQDGTLNFSVDYAASTFLLVGFDVSPLILDVTNEEDPVFLTAMVIDVADDVGCFVALETGVDIFATSDIIEVNEIELY